MPKAPWPLYNYNFLKYLCNLWQSNVANCKIHTKNSKDNPILLCFLLFADTKKELIQHESLICVKVYLLTPLLVNIKQKVEINTELICFT